MNISDFFWKRDRNRRSLLEDLTDFYRQNKSVVFAYFYMVTGSNQESEELTQETFYQAVKSIHRFKGNSSLKTWLLQIARNVYRNKVRSWERERKMMFISDDLDVHGDETYNPKEILLNNQSNKEILDVLNQLPDDYRDILILKEIEGLTHAEIAEILGKTPQTTKVLLHRAKQKFKDLYKKEMKLNEE